MLSSKMGVSDLSTAALAGKRVLMRVDFNVPLNNGTVSDETRVRAAIPTIQKILEAEPASLVLMSHLGRPDGSVQQKYSLKPVVPVLEKLLGGGTTCEFVADCVGELEKIQPTPKLALLENLRFHVEEEGKGVGVGKIAEFLHNETTSDPGPPVPDIDHDEMDVFENYYGTSLYDEEGAAIVPEIMKKAQEKGVTIQLPEDYVCGDKFDAEADTKDADDKTGIPDGWMGLDCGPKSSEKNKELIMQAKTILWNGPQGVFEFPKFATGSLAALDAVCEATKKNGCVSIVGGGDTASLVENAGRAAEISHVSTGGGASLELLEGKELPGVAALSDKQ